MIELLVSLCIISIIFSIPIGKFYIKDYQIDSFTRQLCSDIRYTRIKNLNSDYSTGIYYTKKSNGEVAYVLRDGGECKKEVKLPKNTDISKSVEIIQFSPQGVLLKKGETIIITDKKNNKKREITIVPFSGRVLIKEGIYHPSKMNNR